MNNTYISKQNYLIHLNKLIKYSICNKNIIIIKMYYAYHSDNDIIIQFKKNNTDDIINYIIKLNSKISITNQINNIYHISITPYLYW